MGSGALNGAGQVELREGEYVVQALLKRRKCKRKCGGYEYLVRWQGYGDRYQQPMRGELMVTIVAQVKTMTPGSTSQTWIAQL